MRYEETKHVGNVYTTKEYEGTPEEIDRLMKMQNMKVNSPTINIPSLKSGMKEG
ncbi:hypothetical protein [Virgibacillus sediminis]|uniref:Uncharacterized protein n=1 Tax=Virgibacillus sediminis TaxID=202260 RepID=A0ABV7A6N2_9BACI